MLTLQVSLLFVLFCPQTRVFLLFVPSVMLTFLLHLGCSQSSQEKKNVVEDFKHSDIAELYSAASPASTAELGSLLIMSSPHLAKFSAELE